MQKILIVAILSVVLTACQPAPGADGTGAVGQGMNFPRFVIETVWFVLMCCFVYFMMVTRPRDLKEVQRQKFLKEIKKGEDVLINSSIYGKFLSQSDGVVTVEIAQNTKVRVKAGSVASAAVSAEVIAESKTKKG